MFNAERLESLIETLQEEAEYLLLFLRSVYSIEVYKIPNNSRPDLVFSVNVAQQYQSNLLFERNKFQQQMKKAHSIIPFRLSQQITSVVDFSVEITDRNQVQHSTSWLVANQAGSDSEEILDAAAKQHVFPIVGVALQLNMQLPVESCNSCSRLFCFLPMPAEVTSPLPVHVHGTFGLNDNRRAIKWPTGEMKNDLAAKWNHMLVSNLLPSCYNRLLVEVKNKKHISLDFFYRAFPCVETTSRDPNWKLMLKPLLDLVFGWEFLWANWCNVWVGIESATIVTDITSVQQVVLRVLTRCELNLVNLPSNIFKALKDYYESELEVLTPALCRNTLHDCVESYEVETNNEKLELLYYCLLQIENDYDDLHGLELLPLADESFIKFTSVNDENSKIRYICSEQFPKEILPSLERRLVDVKQELQNPLIKVAASQQTQLEMLTVESFAQLLPKCYPEEWKDKDIVDLLPNESEFSAKWFVLFWRCVHEHDLSPFEGLLVVPLIYPGDELITKVARLSKASDSSLVLVSDPTYSKQFLATLKKLGIHCMVCENIMLNRHNQICDYLNNFDAAGVLTAISNSTEEISGVELTMAEAVEVQTFLASHLADDINLESQHLQALQNISILQVLNDTQPMCLQKASQLSWEGKVILEPEIFQFSSDSLPENLIVLSLKNEQILISLFSSMSLINTPGEVGSFVLNFLIPYIESDECHECEKIDLLMEQVFRLFPVLKQKDPVGFKELTEKLSILPFLLIESESNLRKPPEQLYDPSKKELKSVLVGKLLFPINQFASDQHILDCLRQCKLQTTISGKVIFNLLCDNAPSCSSKSEPLQVSKEVMSRVNAIMSYIHSHCHELLKDHHYLNKSLKGLVEKSWLPVLSRPPENYPSCLIWKGSSCPCHLASPKPTSNVFLCDDNDIQTIPFIVGSQMFVSHYPDVCKLFSMDKHLVIKKVMAHFQHVTENVRSFENQPLDTLVHKIYSYLSSHLKQLKEVFQTSELNMKRLIWVRKQQKFVVPSTMFLNENPSFNHSLHLAPYFDCIPDSLQKPCYNELLSFFGVHSQLTNLDIVSVLKMIRDDSQKVETKQAWKMVDNILNWLTEGGTTSVSTDLSLSNGDNHLFVPIEGSEEEWPNLVPVQEVVYTDLDYLKSFEEEGTTFIHDRFSGLAPHLGVKSLSKHLDIADDAFGDVGQHEPLVTRLKNILKDYQGGLTIIKELLQNADDAGATELTICYDSRTHVATPKQLIFTGMADCHGPALLVHNNATFTDEDFENITKLAGATKMNKPLKIGKFGVGFCSVYHITDIPSFVSGKWLYIFDPTISYLKKEIKDPIKPGKKMSFTEKHVRYSSQLLPYQHLFGFNQESEYKETLFRFPFRKVPSEISPVVYNENHIRELAVEVQRAGSKLLLFLSSVKQITFCRIDSGMNEPSIICVVKKADIPHSLVDNELYSYVNLLQIDVSCCEQSHNNKSKESWIVSRKINYVSDLSKPYVGAVASLLTKSQDGFYSVQTSLKGETFCYLPLSVQTGLPVHVSANFAVLNDRTGIHTSDSDHVTEEVEWNIQLMKNVIPDAYFLLLLAIKQLCDGEQISVEKDYKFYCLWPLEVKLKFHNPFDQMVQQFYKIVADEELFYSPSISKWLHLPNACILSPGILQMTSGNESPPKCVIQVCEQLQFPLIFIPSAYLKHLPQQIIEKQTINEEKFLTKFFTSIPQLPQDIRNEILFLTFKAFILLRKNYIENHLKNEECVPSSPDGKFLKKCSSIVDPKASFSSLYDEDDAMFPLNKFHQDQIVYTSLKELGMIIANLPLPMILERAGNIKLLYQENAPKALERCKTLISCINQLIISSKTAYALSELKNVPFLPVLKKPDSNDYPRCFKWFGQTQTLLCGNKLVKGGSNLLLAGSQVYFLSELAPDNGGCSHIPDAVSVLLGIRSQPSCTEVIKHLRYIETVYTVEGNKVMVKDWVESACEKIYKHIEQSVFQGTHSADDIDTLKCTKCVWTGSEFVMPTSVAKSWSLDGPILFRIPQVLKSKERLIGILELQERFSNKQLFDCLKQLYDENKNSCLEESALKVAVNACKLLGKENFESECICYLPDENGHMSKADELVYNDAPWCTLDEEYITVHEEIPRQVALNLGIIPIRSKALQQYENQDQEWSGVEFGQHEKLTQRIRNILSQYPGDVTVLKELLQNADDAKATKMYVILDTRQHNTNKVPHDNWKDLQGPALFVWNDSGFSDQDFSGIQKLGLGSKRSDAESIGQFGIGFNVVYNLTDCPSFLTNCNTLCVLDPHCRYVPGATTLSPGRRYDGIDQKFWDRWCDLKSTYLLDEEDLDKYPKEIHAKGTLFRFPLRHTKELVEKSQLVDKSEKENYSSSLFGSSCTPLDPDVMVTYLNKWAPKMKEALIFLNSVNELKFFVIQKDVSTSVILTHSYSVKSTDSSMNEKEQFLQCVKRYDTDSCTPCVVQYPIDLAEEKPNCVSEKWLIHQGIGDIREPNQIWHYHQVKPKHGIAANLTGSKFEEKVFCFLPLPIQSKLPVHVNGNFILDAARSGLWKSRDIKPDDKQKWNHKLIEVIASSYANFLVTCQNEYFSGKIDAVNLDKMIKEYYSIFPTWLGESMVPEGEMKHLANQVYHKLSTNNHPILIANISSMLPSRTSIEWLPLHSREEPSKQAHFWKHGNMSQQLLKILLRIGIHLTDAPLVIQEHFDDIGISLPIVDAETVYEYYQDHYKQVSTEFPSFISDTKFESVQDFLVFVKYLLQSTMAQGSDFLNYTYKEFPEPPYDLPLLLTADDKLRLFSDRHQVICSKYSLIFPKDVKKYFAHPKVCDLKLNPDYFIKVDEENWDLVGAILEATIPTALKKERVVNAGELVSIENFVTPIWKCLCSDPVFKKHFHKIVQTWALLLSTEHELFMYNSNCLLPIIEPRKESNIPEISGTLLSYQRQSEIENLTLHNKVFYLIQEHNIMPILDLRVVDLSLCLRLCPRMKEPTKILENLCYLHRANELHFLKKQLLDNDVDEIINILFTYFSSINFSNDTCSLERIKSLPFFKDINGTHRSLRGRLLIWPEHICLSGKDKWVKQIPDNVVFLAPSGNWTKLGSASLFGIEKLSSHSFYVEFIFPSFHILSDQERLQQLQYIRDTPQLFDAALHNVDAEYDIVKRAEGSKFVSQLSNLPCLMKTGRLSRVCDFCDPSITIFQLFVERDEFPPDNVSDEKWLNYFRRIGLRTKASKEEFKTFCNCIASGVNKNILESSKVLLEYLFKEESWRTDKSFLFDISEIPFACTEDLSDLAKIVPVADVENVVQHGSKTYRLTSLSKSAAKPTRNLIWTAKPVVELPNMPFFIPHKEVQEFLNALRLCIKPSYEAIVGNIVRISKSRFAKFELFDVYPESCTQVKGNNHLLCKVLHDCFTQLKKSDYPEEVIDRLKGVPCIPVSRNGDVADKSTPVLVPPLQVIASNSKEVIKLVPFLNPLPTEMYSFLEHVLSKIGVKYDIELDNIQHALHAVYENIELPITNDPNTLEVVKQLIKSMYSCLQDKQDFTGILYLPDIAGKLVESKMLVFNDVERFKDACLDLSSSKFSFLSLLSKKLEELNDYGFKSREFYNKLPESVRPLPLSANYEERLSNESKYEEELSEFAATIKRAFEFPDFVKVVNLLLPSSSSNSESIERFISDLEIFHSSVKVLAATDLQVDVYLTLDHRPLNIGRVKVDFLLQKEASGDRSLYIDKSAYALKFSLFESLTSAIVSHVIRMSSSHQCDSELDRQSIEKVVSMLLKAPTQSEIEELLNDQGIDTANIELKSSTSTAFSPKLGMPIPEEWHHRLHCDIHNVFKPQEWVGYEAQENHIIFAKIEYCMKAVDKSEEQARGCEEQQSITSDEELSQYKITVSDDEEDSQREVTVLDLFKILRVKTRKLDDGSTEVILYDPNGESVQLWDAIKDEKLKSILKEICQELKRIWKLKDKEQRRKAIKAMYLKWHPDKNPNPLATKAFQFLQRQIQRLQEGLPLEDPDETDEVDHPSFTPNNYWDMYFRNWDNIARSRSRRWRQEKTNYWSTSSQSRSHGQSFSFDGIMNTVSVSPEPSTAKVWLKQAEHDMNALNLLAREIDAHRDVCAHVCFLAHQVAEKALKAGMYQVNGLHSSDLRNHHLVGHANALAQVRAGSGNLLRTRASRLESYYLDPRYPNRYSPARVPSDQYTSDQARLAKEAAEDILEIVKTFV